MCCRYYIDDDFPKELNRIVKEADFVFHPGDIRPSESAPMLTFEPRAGLRISPMYWGFSGPEKGLLINARAESVTQKNTFSDSFQSRRLIIPASGFYEWDQEKNRNTFRQKNGGLLFMAGLWRREEKGNCFTIITTAANSSMQPVHDRMPLILNETQMMLWLQNPEQAAQFLSIVPPQLLRKPDYEQLSFL